MSTIFQKTELSEPALFSPSDTTKKIDGFPKICVSTFSENIIQKFSSWDGSEKIAELYTANGEIPVYKICYKDTAIAFYLSRVGAPACVAGFEKIIAMGTQAGRVSCRGDGMCLYAGSCKIQAHSFYPVFILGG